MATTIGKRFPLTAKQCRTLADELALASTLLRAVAGQLDAGKQLDDQPTRDAWLQFGYTMVAVGMRSEAYQALLNEATARGEYP